jgi:hypothetical protein
MAAVAKAPAQSLDQVVDHAGGVVGDNADGRVVRRVLGINVQGRDPVDVAGDPVAIDDDMQAVGPRDLPEGDLGVVEQATKPGVASEPVTVLEGM